MGRLANERPEVVVAEFRQPLKLSQPDEQTNLGLTCSVCKGMSDYSYKRACSWLWKPDVLYCKDDGDDDCAL